MNVDERAHETLNLFGALVGEWSKVARVLECLVLFTGTLLYEFNEVESMKIELKIRVDVSKFFRIRFAPSKIEKEKRNFYSSFINYTVIKLRNQY